MNYEPNVDTDSAANSASSEIDPEAQAPPTPTESFEEHDQQQGVQPDQLTSTPIDH